MADLKSVVAEKLPLTMGETIALAKEYGVRVVDVVLTESELRTGLDREGVLKAVMEEYAHNLKAVEIGVSGGNSFTLGRVDPTYSLGVEPADLNELFPEYVSQPMKNGLKYFDRRIPGFSDSDSVLTAIETRSSSPVRLPRNEAGSAEWADYLFRCGEVCVYGGGIMSA